MTHNEVKANMQAVLNKLVELFPEQLHDFVHRAVYVAGGAIVNSVLDEPVVDYDVFIRTDEARDTIKAYLLEAGPHLAGYEFVTVTENALTMILDGQYKIQLVTRFTGEPVRVFTSFDFEHCKAFYDPVGQALHMDEDLIRAKKLAYTGRDDYPLNTLKRLVKFVRRGWVPDNEMILNLALKLSRTKLDDPEVLRQQKIGFYGSPFV